MRKGVEHSFCIHHSAFITLVIVSLMPDGVEQSKLTDCLAQVSRFHGGVVRVLIGAGLVWEAELDAGTMTLL